MRDKIRWWGIFTHNFFSCHFSTINTSPNCDRFKFVWILTIHGHVRNTFAFQKSPAFLCFDFSHCDWMASHNNITAIQILTYKITYKDINQQVLATVKNICDSLYCTTCCTSVRLYCHTSTEQVSHWGKYLAQIDSQWWVQSVQSHHT